MPGFAKVGDDRDMLTVRVTPAADAPRAGAKYVAVHERDRGLGANEFLKTCSSCVVDPHDHFMTIYESAILLLQQHTTVANHRTRLVLLPYSHIAIIGQDVVLVYRPLYSHQKFLHDLGSELSSVDPLLQQPPHFGEKWLPFLVVVKLKLVATLSPERPHERTCSSGHRSMRHVSVSKLREPFSSMVSGNCLARPSIGEITFCVGKSILRLCQQLGKLKLLSWWKLIHIRVVTDRVIGVANR